MKKWMLHRVQCCWQFLREGLKSIYWVWEFRKHGWLWRRHSIDFYGIRKQIAVGWVVNDNDWSADKRECFLEVWQCREREKDVELKCIAENLHQYGHAHLLGSFWLITVATKMLVCVMVITILLHSYCQLTTKAMLRTNSDTLTSIFSPSIYYPAGKTMHSNTLKVSWTPNLLYSSVMTFTLMKGSCDAYSAVFKRYNSIAICLLSGNQKFSNPMGGPVKNQVSAPFLKVDVCESICLSLS